MNESRFQERRTNRLIILTEKDLDDQKRTDWLNPFGLQWLLITLLANITIILFEAD